MMIADTSSAMNESSGACEEGTAEAGRDFDPVASEGEERASEGEERASEGEEVEERRDDEPAPSRAERGITHGSPLPAAEHERLKEEARRGGTRDRGGPAQRDDGD